MIPAVETMPEISVAVADPAMPICGNGPIPRISSGLSVASTATPSAMNHSGVTESPLPRSPIWISTPIIVIGRPRKITRR